MTNVKHYFLVDIVVPPLGSYHFGMEQTGVSPRDPSSPMGSWLVGITWNGEAEHVKIVGIVAGPDDSGNMDRIRTIYPF